MVDLKDILKKLEKLKTLEEKIEFLKNLIESIEDEEEKQEIIKLLDELFPEDEENLETLLTHQGTSSDYSKATLPIKPVINEGSLERRLPRLPKKKEVEVDTTKYITSQDSLYQDAAQVYIYKPNKYETNPNNNQEPKQVYTLNNKREKELIAGEHTRQDLDEVRGEERLKKDHKYKVLR